MVQPRGSIFQHQERLQKEVFLRRELEPREDINPGDVIVVTGKRTNTRGDYGGMKAVVKGVIRNPADGTNMLQVMIMQGPEFGREAHIPRARARLEPETPNRFLEAAMVPTKEAAEAAERAAQVIVEAEEKTTAKAEERVTAEAQKAAVEEAKTKTVQAVSSMPAGSSTGAKETKGAKTKTSGPEKKTTKKAEPEETEDVVVDYF